jgi:allantoin racemase
VAYKLCELFLDLGLVQSRLAYPAPEHFKDEAFSTVSGAGGV